MAKIEGTESNINQISRISSGTKVKGEITTDSDIRIDGEFDGKLVSKGRVVIGETAVINGDIIGTNVDFWGKIKGNFYVKDTLSLKSSAQVEGDLHIKRLQVELNARFNGSCHMIADGEFERLSGQQQAPKPQQAAQPVRS